MNDELIAASMQFDPAAFAVAHARMCSAPTSLTESDFAQLRAVSQTLVDQAVQLQRSAQPTPLVTKSVTPAAPEDMVTFLKKHGTKPVTYLALDKVTDVFMENAKALQDRAAACEQRCAALEMRITSLEQKPHVKFVGVFKAGTEYSPGDATTHHGGLWICKVQTIGEPGRDFVAWTLAVKSRSVS